jgi:hypothetical protein
VQFIVALCVCDLFQSILQFDLTLLIKPTLFENINISSRVRVTLDKGSKEQGPIQGSICFKLVFELLVLRPLSKMAFNILLSK